MKRPNIVLVFMDDMTHWALTSSRCRTPHLDRLARRGAVLTHAFHQGSMEEAVCMPARQTVLSGLSVHHAAERFDTVPRLGTVLGKAGYDTYFTGKWHNGETALFEDYADVGPWEGAMLHSTGPDGDAYRRPAEDDTWDPADTSRGGHWMRLEDGTVQHSSERWTDAALDFLARDHGGRPFFLHLAFHAPHDPRQAPQEYLDLYPADGIRVPPNVLPEHPFDNGELEVRDEHLAPWPRTDEAVRLHRREYQAMVSHADAQIGRLLDALESSGELEDTLVVFSGDHGLALGEHGLMGKQNLYDHSIRVPLLLAGPGVPAGVRVDDLVHSACILATVCELADVEPPEHNEFPSLVPALHGRDPEPRDAVLGVYRDKQRSVRTRTHKLVLYPPTGHRQLFDLVADPWETTDLSGDPGHADLVSALEARLHELRAAVDDLTAA